MEDRLKKPLIDSKTLKELQVLGRMLIPATLVLLITRVLGMSDYISNITALAALVITVIVLFLPEHFWRLLMVLLAALSVILGIALAGGLNRREYSEDPLVSWENKIKNSLKNCKTDNFSCIAEAITNDYPQNNNYVAEKLVNDLRAGTFLLTNDTIRPMLSRLFGIEKTFLGTGFALSTNDTPYSNVRIAEFFIPNLSDSNPDVATWRFKSTSQNFDKTLKEVILTTTPYKVNLDISSFRKSINTNINQDLDTDKPAVVRLSQLTKEGYLEKLGTEEAKRVLSLHLGSVWNLKVVEIAKMSGHTLNPDQNDEKLLFIWIYLPSHPDEVVPATWNKIIAKLKGWVNT